MSSNDSGHNSRPSARGRWSCGYWASQATLLLIAIAGNAAAVDSAEPVWQQQVVAASQAFMSNYEEGLALDKTSEAFDFDIKAPDARLRFEACAEMPLAEASESAGRKGGRSINSSGRMVLKISCAAPLAWSVYTQVLVRHMVKALQARHPIARGNTLVAGDITSVAVDISRLQRGYFRKVEALADWTAKRSIRPGEILSPGILVRSKAVNRGDRVVIAARTQGISISMTGEALTDGIVGEQISVRNNSSERVVRATVVARGKVEVFL